MATDYCIVMDGQAEGADGNPQYHVHEVDDGGTVGARLSSHADPGEAVDKVQELRKKKTQPGISPDNETPAEGSATEEAGESAATEGAEGGMTSVILSDDFRNFDKGVGAGGRDRDKIPAEDFAGPNRTYPITDQSDVDDAKDLIGKAPNPGAVKAKIIAIAKRKGLTIPDAWQKKESHSMFILDAFTFTKPGEPYRLFPFGVIVKAGVRHVITPAYAKTFKLPHFKPPIKLGSHEDTTPAGGSIASLEVRDDGLYAVPEYTAKGERAVTEGDYRYQSPEVLWDDGEIENPDTGQMMPGPFIVGDALLHTPHLGENAALFSVEPMTTGDAGTDQMAYNHSHEHTHGGPDGITHSHPHNHGDGVDHGSASAHASHSHEGVKMTTEPIKVPTEQWNAFQAFMSLFSGGKGPQVDPEKYAALQAEHATTQAKVDKMEADRLHEKEVMGIAKDLASVRFGAMFQDPDGRMEAAEMFSTLKDPAQRKWFLQKFSALAGQVDWASKIIRQEFGATGGTSVDPVEAFTALIAAKRKEKGFEKMGAALKAVSAEHPDLALQYDATMKDRSRTNKKED